MAFNQNKFIKNVPSFRYGMNTMQEADELNEAEMSDCENVSIESDSVMSAPGYQQWDDVSNPGPYWGGVAFIKSDGTLNTIRQRQGTLEYSIDGGTDYTECTLPAVGSPAQTVVLDQIHPTFAILNDICIFANGQIVMSSSDGITWTEQASLPLADIVFNNGKNRLLYVQKALSQIWWSDINDPLTVGAASWEYIDPNAGASILGIGKTPTGSILVWKDNGLYEIDDVTSGMVGVNFVGDTTLITHHTIATTEDSVIWLGYAAVFEYIGGTIRNIAGHLSWLGRNSVSASYLACSSYYNGKYHLSIPDTEESADYNGQEYIFYKLIPRPDPIQPYAITRNKRYFGCYFQENFEFDYGRDITLYVGDSRPATSGSPAQVNDLYAFVQDYRDPVYASGLNGAAQECWFVTKYFNNKTPYYVKRYLKLFAQLKLINDTQITLGYRFMPYGPFNEVDFNLISAQISMLLEDDSEGLFDEGFGFSTLSMGSIFHRIGNVDNPRGVQFKFKWNQVNDVTLLGMAYEGSDKFRFK